MRPSHGAVLIALVFAVDLSAQTSASPPQLPSQLANVRAALDKYRNPIAALEDGYLSTLVCVEYPASPASAGHVGHSVGGMGVHFLHPGFIGPQLDTLKPQVLIYEPVGDSLKLAAAEWFIPMALAPQQPEMFGRKFDGPMEGHPPIMPSSLHHWDLHVWLWKANPAGMFTSTNPAIKCPARGYTAVGSNSPVGGHH